MKRMSYTLKELMQPDHVKRNRAKYHQFWRTIGLGTIVVVMCFTSFLVLRALSARSLNNVVGKKAAPDDVKKKYADLKASAKGATTFLFEDWTQAHGDWSIARC